jgi:predicted dehydrogenase
MVEKPLAADLAGADGVVEAAGRGGGRVMVNWPFAWWAPFQAALAAAGRGDIGRVWQTRYRAAHQGPKEHGCSPQFYGWLYDPHLNGGGALADYACYGAALARTLIGVPDRVTAAAANCCRSYLSSEDNAVVVMHYPHALATAEASWSQSGVLTSYVTVVCGTDATLLVEPGPEGRLLRADDAHPSGRALDVPGLAPSRQSASAHFLHALRSGEPFMDLCTLGVARDAQAVVEAASRSAASGATVPVAAPRRA